jgi:hypothetical protein
LSQHEIPRRSPTAQQGNNKVGQDSTEQRLQ